MVPEILQYGFMVRAFAAGAVIAVIAPLIGHFLVVRRFALVADTLSHIALSGIAIGLLTNTQPLIVTMLLTMAASLFMERLRASKQIPGEAVLAMFLPGGLALSVVLIGLAHGFNTNLFSYLFGSITTVEPTEVLLITALGVVTVAAVMLLYDKLLYSSFDEESARAGGVPVGFVSTVLMLLTAVTVSLSMRVVGVLLIGALMVIPVVTAMQIARSFRSGIAWSVFFALLSVLAGLTVSYYFDLPAGGVIVLLSLGFFGLASMARRS